MSNEKQESLADIIAEMRKKAECAKPYDDGIVMMLTVLADRLEAAQSASLKSLSTTTLWSSWKDQKND